MSYISGGILKNGVTIGKAKVISTDLLKKGHMVPYVLFAPISITVHETDCPDIPAVQFYNSLKNGQTDTSRTQASFQFVVDATTIRQCVNVFRTCWHAGCKEGNATSIGIEICQYSNNKKLQKQAYLNAIELIKILREEIKTIIKVVRHYDWTKKNCPSYLLNKKYSGLTWAWFSDQLKETKKSIENNKDYNCKAVVSCDKTLNVRDKRVSNGILGDIIDTLENKSEVTLGYVLNNWGSIYYIKEGKIKHGFVNVKYLKFV